MKKHNTNLFGQKLNVSQAIDSNAEGKGTITRNIGENANGTFNVSNTGSEDSKKTIHSIGIGTKDSDRSNALEIMQNGDIYLYGVGGYEGDNASDSKSIQSIIQDSQSGGDYTLPIASADTLGGIKVGEGLNIDGEGVLSSTGSGVGKVDSMSNGTGEIFNCYDGYDANSAIGKYSHSEGFHNSSPKNYSHSEGSGNIAGGICSHVEGRNNEADGECSHAEGESTIADYYSHSEGYHTKAGSMYTHAEGYYTQAKNNYEHAQGKYNKSDKGNGTQNMTIHSIGIGINDNDRKNAVEVMQNGDNYVYGIGGYDGTNYSEAQTLQEVVNSLSSGSGGGVGKIDNTYEEEGQIIYGEIFNAYDGVAKNIASGQGSHAEGAYNKALGIASHTEGIHTIANNVCEHAEGIYNKSNNGEKAADNTLHSIGIGASDDARKNAVEVMQNGDVYINGVGSYDGTNYADAQTLQEVINSQSGGGVGKVDSESNGTGEIFNDYTNNKATGTNAHAQGSKTTASGIGSHAEGYNTTADGMCSHTEGQYTSTHSSYAHAEGFSTIANNIYEHAQGTNNMSNTGSSDSDKTIHSIGIGKTSSNRCNAVEVMTNGDQYIYGIGSYDGTNYSSAQTLQEVISNIQNTIWIGTQTQYDQLESKNENTLYFITE